MNTPAANVAFNDLLFIRRAEYRATLCRAFRINDLPVEILSNILNYVCWSSPNNTIAIKWRLYVTWVCRHWRNVAIRNVTLWNAVFVNDPPYFERSLTWLERARESVTDVRMLDTPTKRFTLECTERIVKPIIDKIAHIRSVVMVVDDWDPLIYLLKAFSLIPKDKLLPTILHSFELHRTGSVYRLTGAGLPAEDYNISYALFGGVKVPSLRHVAFNGVHIDWENSKISNLTTLDIRRLNLEKSPTLTRFRAILQASPDMNRILMDGGGPKYVEDRQVLASLKPILLPKLRHLMFGDYNIIYALYALSQMDIPNVVDLTLMEIFGENLSPFFALLKSKTTKLQNLTLSMKQPIPPNSVAAVVTWLAAQKDLYFLRLRGTHKTFIESFLYDSQTMARGTGPSEHIPCPGLKYLEVHSLDTDLLSDFVEARLLMGAPLTKIYIGEHTHYSLKEEQVRNLGRLANKHKYVDIKPLPARMKAPEALD
ncbi:hypothetical protein CPC08DRAFT_627677 [Agrocybe pediades]|nr:hypothetical protein CPC08DRAFT_627677 [Agrocybe pediades]